MTVLDRLRGKGAHHGAAPSELRTQLDDVTCDLTRAIIAGCSDRMNLTITQHDLQTAVAEIRRLHRRVIRAEADKKRLRQAVINARPRITVAVQRLDRPYIAQVQTTPYPLPAETGDISREAVLRIPALSQHAA
jgi:hypothetical protein